MAKSTQIEDLELIEEYLKAPDKKRGKYKEFAKKVKK